MHNVCVFITMALIHVGYAIAEYKVVHAYELDSSKYCSETVHQYYVSPEDVFQVLGESSTLFSVPFMSDDKCQIKFSISSKSSKKFISIKLTKFIWNGCGMHLRITESPSLVFHSHVEEIAYFSCRTISPEINMQAKKDNNVMFTLEQNKWVSGNYYFKFNLTVTDGPEDEEGMTMGITIGIVIICVTALIVLSIVMVKIIRNVPCKRNHKNSTTGEAVDGSRVSPTVSYSAIAGCTETTPAQSSAPLTLHGRPYDQERDYNYADVVFSEQNTDSSRRDSQSNGPNRPLDSVSDNMLPPSYNEAINMPKPGETLPTPEYQNIPVHLVGES